MSLVSQWKGPIPWKTHKSHTWRNRHSDRYWIIQLTINKTKIAGPGQALRHILHWPVRKGLYKSSSLFQKTGAGLLCSPSISPGLSSRQQIFQTKKSKMPPKYGSKIFSKIWASHRQQCELETGICLHTGPASISSTKRKNKNCSPYPQWNWRTVVSERGWSPWPLPWPYRQQCWYSALTGPSELAGLKPVIFSLTQGAESLNMDGTWAQAWCSQPRTKFRVRWPQNLPWMQTGVRVRASAAAVSGRKRCASPHIHTPVTRTLPTSKWLNSRAQRAWARPDSAHLISPRTFTERKAWDARREAERKGLPRERDVVQPLGPWPRPSPDTEPKNWFKKKKS